MGHYPAHEGIDGPGTRTMLALLADGAWVKLSGAYRLDSAPWRHTLPLARRCLDAAPTRCVWGSDWPHVAHWDRMMNVAELLDLLADWAPDARTRELVFVHNPRRLYGFPEDTR